MSLAVCLAATACIHPTKSVQINECYELVRDAMLIRTKCPALMKDYMILDDSALPYSCLDTVVDRLKRGEQVHINEAIYQWQGATGSCWRVFADLPGRRDIGLVEVPSCFPGLTQPSGWASVEDGLVEVNPERLRECPQ